MMIETSRLLIRPFSPADAQDFYEIFGDAETMENCEPAYDFEKAKNFLQDFCINRHGALAAQLKGTGKVIGYILFHEFDPGVYEIGWIFNRAFWRPG